ncbi:MAG: TIGR00159 family protein [Phototrophicales bacterium]|nr:MAG: TIGR00159 family protein [Phototrophicales bacterium]
MDLIWTLQSIDATAILDILLVAGLIFATSFLVRGTTAMPLLRGVVILLVAIGIISSLFDLVALNWLLRNILTASAVAIPIIFQPELRRMLERLGRARLMLGQVNSNTQQNVIDAICQAASRLSERRHGALIVLERGDILDEFIDTGVYLDAALSPQLLLTIFWPKTELHDGAVIVRGDRIMAAGCVLPLSSARQITDRKMGTRHRASVGMSEVSDAVVVTVSEETGQISVSNRGRMIRRLDAKRLATILSTFYSSEETTEQNRLDKLVLKVRRWLGAATDNERGDAAA